MFSPSRGHVKGLLSKFTVLKVDFIIRPSNILFASVYVCTVQPGNFTGSGSEGVNFHSTIMSVVVE